MPVEPSSSLREVHAASGAVFADRRGLRVVASFGDPAAEYAAALENAGLADLPERGALEASGPRRVDFLHGILSNDVAGLRPGQGCRAALMTSKGHVVALLRVLVGTDAVRLEMGAERLDAATRSLEHYRVAAPVRFRPLPVAVLALLGLRAADVLRASGVEVPRDPEGHVAARVDGTDVLVARAGDLPGGGFVVHVPPGDSVRVWKALRAAGARPVGRDALDARRVEDLRPWDGDDVGEGNLLHETGLVRELHSPAKGCYVGQETVARLEARGGHVNKALRRLRLSGPAATGEPVRAGSRDVGRVTTAALSPRYGPVAMAYVHRDHFAPGTALEVAGAQATVVDSFDEE